MHQKFRLSLSALCLSTAATALAQQAPADSLSERFLGDAVVTGTRAMTTSRSLPFTISSVGRQTLCAMQRTNILPTLTEQVPGLFVTSRGVLGYGVSGGAAGGISVRGLSASSGQLLVLIDGQPQYNGIYGHSIADSYQTMMAERVEVLRGPASVLYGSNAMGGVVNIVTRRAKEDGVFTHVNLGGGSYATFQGEASNVVRRGRFSSTVAANYSRSDNHRPRMDFEQYGGYARVGYDLGDYWHAFADADVTHFAASYPGTTSAPMYEADQWITRGVATLALENHYEHTNGRISVYDSFGRHKINDGYAEGAKPQTRFFRSKDALTGVSAYQNLTLWPGSSITLGFDFQHIFGHAYYTSRATGEVLPTPNKQSARKIMDEQAGYVDVRQQLASWLTVDAGVRYDNHSIVGGEWIPQFALVALPCARGELRAAVSKGFRNPTLREMYLYPPSNDELRPERLWNYEVAWHHRLLGGRLSYGVNLFMMEGDNLIQTATVALPGGGVKKQNVNTGTVSNKGVEAEASWAIGTHWSLTTNHSYLHMKNPVLAAPEYKGYLGATMRYGRWTAQAGMQQVCGLYTTVGTGADTKETFSLLNAVVGYQLLRQLQLWVKGDNLLAQRYEINAGCPMPRATVMGGVNLRF